MPRIPYRWIFVLMIFIATCCSRVGGFWFFSCPHGNGQGQAGDVCSAFCRCHPLNTCEAGIQRCARPGVYGERCHATRPCATGFSCHPGVQKCFHVPRRHGEPCVAGYACKGGLSCEPGVQLCFRRPREYNEPCSAGFSCSPGLSCQPGYQRCLHHPRRENERCSAGYACADGLVCRLCDKPYATCQLARVPALTEQDYDRPFNKVAFLVTHNSFSNSPDFAVWARNQRFSVSQQLKDGVRGLMLDIYPGWGGADVRLCHASCFWSGSTNLLDTLIEIRKFLETNKREVITIFFEDYLKNPTILKQVFDQAGTSPHVLRKENWGDGFNDWPTLTDMRRLGRLVVFNNNGLSGFPYTKFNMWRYVRENRYGNAGQNKKECVDRPESRWNKSWNDRWSLVLINWFSTAGNPLQPCLNSFREIRDKLVTCQSKFGLWANFVAVNFYTADSGGGAFQAVNWLNNMFRGNKPVAKERKASIIPLPLPDNLLTSGANQQLQSEVEPNIQKNTIDNPGYGSGFHDLSDIIAHILEHHIKSWVKKNNTMKNPLTAFPAKLFNSNSSTVSHAGSSQSHNNNNNNKRGKIGKSHLINETNMVLPGNVDWRNRDVLSTGPSQFNHRILHHKNRSFHGKLSPWEVPRSKIKTSLEKGFENVTKFRESLNSTNGRLPVDLEGKYNALVTDNRRRKSIKLPSFHHVAEDLSREVTVYQRGKKYHDQSLSVSTFRDKTRKVPNITLRKASHGGALHVNGSQGKLALTLSGATRQHSLSTIRLSTSTLRHNTIVSRKNPTAKLRNLRRQIARLKTKLNEYRHLAHRGAKMKKS